MTARGPDREPENVTSSFDGYFRRPTPREPDREPVTAAGRRLLDERGSSDYMRSGFISMPWRDWETTVLAIEAEARDTALREEPDPMQAAALERIYGPARSVYVSLARTTSLAAATEGRTLDVERLEAALRAHGDAFIEQPESFDSHRAVAESIAAEYVRLAASAPTPRIPDDGA